MDDNIVFEETNSDYLFSFQDPNFAINERSNIRYVAPFCYGSLLSLNPNGPDPFEYFHYAKTDLRSNDERGVINATGNCKRAVHLTIDCFIDIIGLGQVCNGLSFPKKLEVISALDAFPTSLIDKLNRNRNLIEHDYACPDTDETAEFVEVTEMFLRLCYPLIKKMTLGLWVGLAENDRNLGWYLNPEAQRIYDFEFTGSAKSFDSAHGKIYYNYENVDDYISKLHGLKEPVCFEINKKTLARANPYLSTFIYYSKQDSIPKTPAYDPREKERIVYTICQHIIDDTGGIVLNKSAKS